jgi:predicted porin
LALLSGAASAQVTVFGVLDLAAVQLRASGAASMKLLNGDGNTSSRLGLRGSENLGGGWQANFWMETAINVDAGTSGATSTNNIDSVNTGSLTWGRRSTIGLQGPWGEWRLGRDYVPSFANLTTAMHPFGTNGVGSSGLLFYPVNAGGTTVRTSVRASNALVYQLPSGLGGFYGSAMVATGEQAGGTATSRNGQHQGLRLGYRAGPFNIAAAQGRTSYTTGDYTQRNVGVNLQWGPAKLMALWGDNQVGVTKTSATMLGTQLSLGAGELRLAYTVLQAQGVANDARQWAAGYVHDLSKRSSVYGTVSAIDNRGNGTRFNVGLSPTTPGGSSSGLEVGLRHSF